MNKRALEDADLYFRTGRVRTPSPALSSDLDGPELPERQTGIRAQAVCTPNPAELIGGGTTEQGSEAPLSHVIVVLSSDSEEEFCRCKKVDEKGATDILRTEPVENRTADTDSTFHINKCASDSERSRSANFGKHRESEENLQATTKSYKNLSPCNNTRCQERVTRTTTSTQYQRTHGQQVSSYQP